MIQYSIFLIDDEESIRRGISMNLKQDYKIQSFSNAEDAIEHIRSESPDLVLLDIGLPGMDGIEALQEIKNIDPKILVIMVTGFEDIESVISSMKQGAYDYIIKPIQIDALKHSIKNALETIRLKKEVQELQADAIKENMPCIIGESDAIQDVMNVIDKAASSPVTPIMITGESGTGKELIASAIHHQSPNFRGPFITLNCASIPNELIESELFGYEKGAFSGALTTGKKGLIEEADGGTLFLDEIGDLSLAAQAKLLRWLENGKYYRVGGTTECQSNTRVVSATNKDLEQLTESKEFRIDLYYRIGVIKIQIPSLNERKEDIIPIAEYFLSEYNKKFNRSFVTISDQAKQILKSHNWVGNIRELKNYIERGIIMGTEPELTVQDLGMLNNKSDINESMAAVSNGLFPNLPEEGIQLEEMETHYINEALRIANGNDAKAAKLLGLSYYAFRYRRKKIEKGDEE